MSYFLLTKPHGAGAGVGAATRAWQEIRLVHIINLDDLRAISEAVDRPREPTRPVCSDRSSKRSIQGASGRMTIQRPKSSVELHGFVVYDP